MMNSHRSVLVGRVLLDVPQSAAAQLQHLFPAATDIVELALLQLRLVALREGMPPGWVLCGDCSSVARRSRPYCVPAPAHKHYQGKGFAHTF